MTIKQIKSIIVGKWKYQDGRILEFISGQEYIVIGSDGQPTTSRIFFREQNGSITLSMPELMEAIGIIKSVSQDRIVYDSVNLDGTRIEMTLSRI